MLDHLLHYLPTGPCGDTHLIGKQRPALSLQPNAVDTIAASNDPHSFDRRGALLLPAVSLLAIAQPAEASKLPEAADKAWEAIGGGPADLVFPQSFLGVWNVQSILVSVELPLGPDYVGDLSVVRRAEEQDKGRSVLYQAAFVPNGRGQVVIDRRFNTASLMHTYLGYEVEDVAQRITWSTADPNALDMQLPNGMRATTRVTKRAEEWPADADRLTTSEYFQQILELPGEPQAKVKASQAFTKYHWRAAEEARGGPEIVATQVVSDYASPSSGTTGQVLLAGGRPITIYTYKMAFSRADPLPA